MPDDRFLAWYLDVQGDRASGAPLRGVGAQPAGACVAHPLEGVRAGVVADRACPAWSGSPAGATSSSRRTSSRHRRARAASCSSCTTWRSTTMPETAPHHDGRWRRRVRAEAARCGGGDRAEPGDADGPARDTTTSTPRESMWCRTAPMPTRSRPSRPTGVDAMRARRRIDGALHRVPRRARAAEEPRASRGGVRAPRRQRRRARDRGRRRPLGSRLRDAGRRGDRLAAARAPGSRDPTSATSKTWIAARCCRARRSSRTRRARRGSGSRCSRGSRRTCRCSRRTRPRCPEVAGGRRDARRSRRPGGDREGPRELLADEDLRNVLRAAGTARVAVFTWQRSARETAAVLRLCGAARPLDCRRRRAAGAV